ncbi:hypothetical protein [Kosakonia sp.]|uniref:hypothetical protein n=1 Tax=Kosakonia sp. TaxID=1916651 RepID=UPI0028A1E8A9|nr:hypothetical protein [Kosakonia sp.]
MLKRIILLMLCAACALPAMAAQTLKNGVLQAYWLPVWNNEGTKSTAELKYRYFVLTPAGKVDKVINVTFADNDAIVKRAFSQLPPSFMKYSEGHAEQAGQLTIDGLKAQPECDRHLYSAKAVKFTPTAGQAPVKNLETAAGCEAYPWAVTYTLKTGLADQHFKQQPEATAKDLQPVLPEQPLIKIETVDGDWIRAAVLDQSKSDLIGEPQGYLRLETLQPVN